jgi:uncharacterized SAM-binding protein YcdF (DUF218 family)/glycosyltransferase involved in cell wall biosynthesis
MHVFGGVEMTSPIDLLKNRNFIIISSIDWTEIRQMPQQLASSIVSAECKVLFIENTGVRSPHFGDVSRIGARIRNWLKGTRGFFDVQDKLTVFSPLFIPFPYSKVALFINRFLLNSAIEKWMHSNRFYNPIIISFLPTPLADSLIKHIDPELIIYYCANDMAGGSAGAAPLRSYEESFFSSVDAVFCNSNALMEVAKKFAKNTYLFPAGVDFAKFENSRKNLPVPADLGALSGDVVGYVGAVSGVFDQDLLVYAAKALPDVKFVLIGPVYVEVSLLKACPNIILLGERPHDMVPAYIKGFNVALIPYVKNAFTDAVYSCKLNEYLAMGVAVVATDLREFRLYVLKHGNVLQIAKTHSEFAERIRIELLAKNQLIQAERIKAARINSWENRFNEICLVIAEHLVLKGSKKLNWQSRLMSRYRISQAKISKNVFSVIALYAVLFNSPLIWFAGKQLAVRHDPKIVDAIVVFSGDGESSYINESYQRRALDAIRYYKSGYAPLIILSSGKDQTFSEVEIIRALLIRRGVPEQAIQILEKYPRSTHENVSLVKKILIARKVKSILLITSPYHSRRALWVWRKAMPEISLVAPVVVDTPQESMQWMATTKQIKVICYEYLAIVFYWWKGWL